MFQRDFDFSNDNNSKKLSVVLMADSFFYSIFDSNHTMVCHQSYVNVRFSDPSYIQIIKNDQRLSRVFVKVMVVLLTGDNHQIDFKDDEIVKLFPGLELKNVRVEKMPGQHVYNYFGINPHQETLLNILWHGKDVVIKSLPSLLATYFIGSAGALAHIHMEEGIIFIYIQRDDKLMMYNSFVTNHKTDILYFILAACQSSGIDPASDIVTLSGWIEKDSTLFTQLAAYIGNLEIINDNEFKLYQNIDSALKPHFYFTHHANILCAL